MVKMASWINSCVFNMSYHCSKQVELGGLRMLLFWVQLSTLVYILPDSLKGAKWMPPSQWQTGSSGAAAVVSPVAATAI